MKERISFKEVPQEPVAALLLISKYLKKSGLEDGLRELIEYRVSQINGCAFCLDMHHKDAIHHGETEQRLHSLPAWRECPWYSDRERAALAYTDSLTTHADADEPIFATLTSFFNNKEIADLTFAITLTNTWNRLNIAFRTTPGTYQVGQFG
ncbi:MAG TPA: carboxymuconolactone decarboxylase family protein [Puia sp.]|jgi:AhpD family alkylhydroperoxidase|nr:carboxymuconolactone decarboxylase family protein [Puia sp.]